MRTRTTRFGAVEIVPERLYRLGGIVRNDGRLSWSSATEKGWVPINCYLLTNKESAMLIDTGVAAHRQQLLLQLKELIPPTQPLSIFLTRAEADCIGNLDEVVRGFNVVGVFSGGRQNPFDFIDDALSHMLENAYDEDTVKALSGRPLERRQDDEEIDLGEGRILHVHAAPLRILTTFWLYDDETKSLFTSDFMGHCEVLDQSRPTSLTTLIPSSEVEQAITQARKHMLQKFEWMEIADKVTLRSKLMSVLDKLDIENVAPTHGRVLEGSDVVHQQFDIVGSALWGSGALVM